MNLQYLGDAFDHWKGSVFETLQLYIFISRFTERGSKGNVSDFKKS
jgi:hypothetical protein